MPLDLSLSIGDVTVVFFFIHNFVYDNLASIVGLKAPAYWMRVRCMHVQLPLYERARVHAHTTHEV